MAEDGLRTMTFREGDRFVVGDRVVEILEVQRGNGKRVRVRVSRLIEGETGGNAVDVAENSVQDSGGK